MLWASVPSFHVALRLSHLTRRRARKTPEHQRWQIAGTSAEFAVPASFSIPLQENPSRLAPTGVIVGGIFSASRHLTASDPCLTLYYPGRTQSEIHTNNPFGARAFSRSCTWTCLYAVQCQKCLSPVLLRQDGQNSPKPKPSLSLHRRCRRCLSGL